MNIWKNERGSLTTTILISILLTVIAVTALGTLSTQIRLDKNNDITRKTTLLAQGAMDALNDYLVVNKTKAAALADWVNAYQTPQEYTDSNGNIVSIKFAILSETATSKKYQATATVKRNGVETTKSVRYESIVPAADSSNPTTPDMFAKGLILSTPTDRGSIFVSSQSPNSVVPPSLTFDSTVFNNYLDARLSGQPRPLSAALTAAVIPANLSDVPVPPASTAASTQPSCIFSNTTVDLPGDLVCNGDIVFENASVKIKGNVIQTNSQSKIEFRNTSSAVINGSVISNGNIVFSQANAPVIKGDLQAVKTISITGKALTVNGKVHAGDITIDATETIEIFKEVLASGGFSFTNSGTLVLHDKLQTNGPINTTNGGSRLVFDKDVNSKSAINFTATSLTARGNIKSHDAIGFYNNGSTVSIGGNVISSKNVFVQVGTFNLGGSLYTNGLMEFNNVGQATIDGDIFSNSSAILHFSSSLTVKGTTSVLGNITITLGSGTFYKDVISASGITFTRYSNLTFKQNLISNNTLDFLGGVGELIADKSVSTFGTLFFRGNAGTTVINGDLIAGSMSYETIGNFNIAGNVSSLGNFTVNNWATTLIVGKSWYVGGSSSFSGMNTIKVGTQASPGSFFSKGSFTTSNTINNMEINGHFLSGNVIRFTSFSTMRVLQVFGANNGIYYTNWIAPSDPAQMNIRYGGIVASSMNISSSSKTDKTIYIDNSQTGTASPNPGGSGDIIWNPTRVP